MQVKFRQSTRNGCGSLSLANIFDDHRFAIGLEDLQGERIYHLNKKIEGIGGEIFIDCIFVTQKIFKIGDRLKLGHQTLFTLPRKGLTKRLREIGAVPYLFTIANSAGRNPHMVAVIHSISDNMFHMVNSSKPEILAMTYRELVTRFHITSVALFRFADKRDGDHGTLVMMAKSELPHIFE